MDLTLIISLFVLFLCVVGLSWFAGSDAPYVPTKMDKINELLKKAGVKKGRCFYELGSGDGRVVFAAAKLGADSIGIEQSWIRVWSSRYKAKKLKLKNAHFIHGNIFDRNYYPADILYIYLLRPALARLEPKLQNELKKRATIITQTYHFPNWKPSKTFGPFNIYRRS